MKRKFTFLTAALGLLMTFLAAPQWVWGQTKAEEVYKTALFGPSYNNQSVGGYTSTWTATNDGFTVSLTNFNNNNNGWNYVKCGRKNNASVGTITTSAAIDKAITKVDITIDALTASKINSITLYTSSDNSNWTSAGTYTKSTGVQSVSITSPAANMYYKIEFDCASGSSNGLITISKVEYYYSVASEPTCTVFPTSWDFGEMQAGSATQQKTFTVTTANLTADLTVSLSEGTYYSTNVHEISQSATSTEITVTLDPTTVGTMYDILTISGDGLDEDVDIELNATGLCNAPSNALSYSTPVNLTLSGDDVSTTLNPTENTGNGGSIAYTLKTGDENHVLIDGNEITFDAIGTYVITATQSLNGTTCGGTFDITINVTGTTPTCIIDPNAYEFGTVLVNSNNSHEFTVTTANLTGDLTVAIDNDDKGFSVSPTTILQGAASTTVTVTYHPTAAHDEVLAELSISGGGLASASTAVISGTASAGNTVTFNAGTGSCTVPSITNLSGSSIDLPEASTVTAPEGWTFAGWCATDVAEATTTQPTLLSGSYTITGDATLYAVYSKTEGVATTDNVTLSEGVYSGSGTTGQITWTETFITINQQKGNSSTSVSSDYISNPRWYQDHIITMTPASSINYIVITQYDGKYGLEDNGTSISNGNVTVDDHVVTITPTNGAEAVTITLGAQARISVISVNYGSGTTYYHTSPTSKVETPTIEVAGVSTGASNTYYETATITLDCDTDGATIHYTTDGDDPTSSSPTYSDPFAVTSTSTIKAIAVKDGSDDSEIASQTITIVQPNVATFTNGVYTTLNTSDDFNTWYKYSVTGTQEWCWNYSYDYVEMSGYENYTKYENEDWFISPKMQVINGKLGVTFGCYGDYGDQNMISIYYSTDYPGYGDPTSNSYTWTMITNNTPSLPYNLDTDEFIDVSCSISELQENENVCFAFKYTSTTETAGNFYLYNFTAKQCYAVTYDANGGTGTMTDNDSPYAVGATVTTLANTFTAPAGKDFEAWNTQADGEGTVYAEGATFEMGTAPVTLYAKWIVPCTVTATMATTSTENEYVNDSGNKSWTINLTSSVSVLGGCDITEYGFVYSTSESTPTTETENTTKVAIGAEYTVAGTQFSHAITGVDENTTYYMRSYATNAAGTAYSEVATATTESFPTYTISYSTNGNDESETTDVYQGDNISSLIEPTSAYIPNGYTFRGWYNGDYALSDDAPVYVKDGDAIESDLNLKAVFAIGTTSEGDITKSYGWEDNDDDSEWIIDEDIDKTSGQGNTGTYAGKINTNNTYVTFNSKVKVKEFSFAFKRTSNNSNYNVYIETSSNNADWTAAETYAMSTFENGSYLTKTKTFDGTNELYVRFHCYNTTAVRYVDDVTIIYDYENTTYSSYCTSVSSPSIPVDGEGVMTADATIPADAAYTLTTAVIIPNGRTLTVNGILGNANVANLIIQDGGQLIVNNAGVQATVKKSVAHGTSKDANNWYVISSPVNNIASADVTNLIQATPANYDYYYYDEASHTWMNHKANAITNMTNGKGYLYWNANGDELSFPGEINSGDVAIDLTVTEGDLAGWNLIGNPYTHNIYKGAGTAIKNSDGYVLETGFYTLSNAGAWTASTDNTAIVPGQGLLVKATTAGTLTMTNTNASGSAKANNDYIQFVVSDSQYEDVAYAWFDKEIGLDKINHRNANIPMIYIPQDGQRYAIATMDDDTEMFNLNFKAATIGKYTLSVKAKGMFSYIHVIDRLTGEDIDMLVDDYSFIGSPRDDENRFIVKLSYNVGINELDSNAIFAYQNGNDIIVNGEGLVQVYDVMGRFVTSFEVNGSKRINASEFSNAVYIFRMIGNDVKTQKIVVR